MYEKRGYKDDAEKKQNSALQFKVIFFSMSVCVCVWGHVMSAASWVCHLGQLDTKVARFPRDDDTRPLVFAAPSLPLHSDGPPPTLFPFKEHILFICPPYALFIHGGGFEVQAL